MECLGYMEESLDRIVFGESMSSFHLISQTQEMEFLSVSLFERVFALFIDGEVEKLTPH